MPLLSLSTSLVLLLLLQLRDDTERLNNGIHGKGTTPLDLVLDTRTAKMDVRSKISRSKNRSHQPSFLETLWAYQHLSNRKKILSSKRATIFVGINNHVILEEEFCRNVVISAIKS